jgi:hypothetical protein
VNKRRYRTCCCNEADKTVQRDRKDKQKNLLDQKMNQQGKVNSQNQILCQQKKSCQSRKIHFLKKTSTPSNSMLPQDKKNMHYWYHFRRQKSCQQDTSRSRSTRCIQRGSTLQQGTQGTMQQTWIPR